MIVGVAVTRGSRWIALALTVFAVGTIGLTMAGTIVATYQPWRFLVFMPVERQPWPALIIGAGLALLGVAGWLGLRNRAAVRWTSAAAASGVLILLCAGFVGGDSAEETEDLPGVVVPVAKSPDGRFEVVARPRSGNVSRYRLRTTGWLLGRESQTDLACTAVETTRSVDVQSGGSSSTRERVSAVRVEQARFVDDLHVELRMTDGRTWTVGFDAGSLRADRYLDWCSGLAQEPR